jgi:hypothetical protein
MPKPKKEPVATGDLCRGGRSFGCKKIVGDAEKEGPVLGPHKTTNGGYRCRFCNEYMGCKLCAQSPSELVCLRCHDWAMDAGEKKHGRMVKDREKGAEALKLVNMIYDSRISSEDGLKCMSDLFPGNGADKPDPFWEAVAARHRIGANVMERVEAGREGRAEVRDPICNCPRCTAGRAAGFKSIFKNPKTQKEEA